MASTPTHVNGSTRSTQTKENVKNIRCGGLITYTLTEHQFEMMYEGRHGDMKLNIGLSCLSFIGGLWVEDILRTEKTETYVAVFWCLNVFASIIGLISIILHFRTRQQIDKLYSTLKKESANIESKPQS